MNFLFRKHYSPSAAGFAAVLTAVLLTGCGRDPEEFLRAAGETGTVHETVEPERETGETVSEKPESGQNETGNLPEEESAEEQIYIDLCGAVKSPGVYCVKPGSRLFEAIEMAGGLREDAAVSFVNRASVITDGQKVYIPTVEETEALNLQQEALTSGEDGLSSGGIRRISGEMILTSGREDGRVDLNTAGVQELMTLPGIGEAKAKAIVRYREENGPFAVPEDLMKVAGIKQAVFDGLRDNVKAN